MLLRRPDWTHEADEGLVTLVLWIAQGGRHGHLRLCVGFHIAGGVSGVILLGKPVVTSVIRIIISYILWYQGGKGSGSVLPHSTVVLGICVPFPGIVVVVHSVGIRDLVDHWTHLVVPAVFIWIHNCCAHVPLCQVIACECVEALRGVHWVRGELTQHTLVGRGTHLTGSDTSRHHLIGGVERTDGELRIGVAPGVYPGGSEQTASCGGSVKGGLQGLYEGLL